MRSMLELLRCDRPFDRVEGFFFGTNKADEARITLLTDELQQAEAQIKSQSDRIDYLLKENTRLKEENEKQSDSIETLNLRMNTLQEEVRLLREDPHARPSVFDGWWHGKYNVRAFIMISPDRKSAYKFYIQDEVDDVLKAAETWEQWRRKTKNDKLSCSANVWCVIGCESISALLKRYDVKFADMVLTTQWQEIEDPDNTEVRSLIILESKAKREQRAMELRKERERAQDDLSRFHGVPPDKNFY